MIRIVAFDFNRREVTEHSGAAGLSAAPAGTYLWVDIRAEEGDSGEEVLRRLVADELVVANVLGADEDGRFDIHDSALHLGLSEVVPAGERSQPAGLDVVVTERALITWHRGELRLIEHMRRTYREDFLQFSESPGFLIFELADALLAIHRRTAQRLSEAVTALQTDLMERSDEDLFASVMQLMRHAMELRRSVMAARDVLHEAGARRSRFVPETTQPFVLGVVARLERLADDVARERETLSDSIALYTGLVGHRTNRVVKWLTVVSALFLPLTFLCGVYGMNFEWMPELAWRPSYPVFWALVVLLVAVMLRFFRRQGWM